MMTTWRIEKMGQKQSQKKSDKVNEIIQTLKLLGIGTKSFSINFDELPTYIRVNDQNQRLPEHHGAYQKTDIPPAP
jgi:hypothetical protein